MYKELLLRALCIVAPLVRSDAAENQIKLEDHRYAISNIERRHHHHTKRTTTDSDDVSRLTIFTTEIDPRNIIIPDEEAIREARARCPRRCPLGEAMVCARCVHGVYRTFPSVCHMRMFMCTPNAEPLELVSRSACAMSAPLLSAAPPSYLELAPEDPPLLFINCRQRLEAIADDDEARARYLDSNPDCEIFT